MGPFLVGVSRFQIEVDPPQWQKIPRSELIGPSVLIMDFLIDGRRFNHVGFFVNNYYASDPSADPIAEDGWPNPHNPKRIIRDILASQPRVHVDSLFGSLPPQTAPSLTPSVEKEDDDKQHDEKEDNAKEDDESNGEDLTSSEEYNTRTLNCSSFTHKGY